MSDPWSAREYAKHPAGTSGMTRSDQDVVASCLAGDANAFSLLVERHGVRGGPRGDGGAPRGARGGRRRDGRAATGLPRRADAAPHAAALVSRGRRHARHSARYRQDAPAPCARGAPLASGRAHQREVVMSLREPLDLEPQERATHRLLSAVPPQTLPLGFRDAVMRRVTGDPSVGWEWVVGAVLALPSLAFLAFHVATRVG